VYTIAGAKGGVGKTTTSINLGTMLAEAGYSTVVVELDLAMANIVDFLDIDLDTDEDTTLHDVLAGDASVTEAIYEAKLNLSVVPSGTTLGGYADTDLDRLPDIVEALRWQHDIVLLDTPAGLSEETVRPLKLADDVLLVSTPRVASIRNVSNTKELAERVDTPVHGLVLTKSGTGASPGADEISAFLDVELLGHVPEDDAVPHAQDHGTPVVVDAPNSGAATAYRKISRQFVDTDTAPPTDAGSTDQFGGEQTVPATHRTEGTLEMSGTESVGATDCGHTVQTPDTTTDDSDLLNPSRRHPDTADGPSSPESTGSPDSSESPNSGATDGLSGRTDTDGSQESDADAEDESASVIEQSDPAATGTPATDAPAGDGLDETAKPVAADRSPDADDGDKVDTDEADGLGARMRSLFSL